MSKVQKRQAPESEKYTKPEGTPKKNKTEKASQILKLAQTDSSQPGKYTEQSGNASSKMIKNKPSLTFKSSNAKRKPDSQGSSILKKQNQGTANCTNTKTHPPKPKPGKYKKRTAHKSKMASNNSQKELLYCGSQMEEDTEITAVKFEPTQISSNWMTLLKNAPPKKTYRPQGVRKKKVKAEEKTMDTPVTETTNSPDIWFDDVDDLLLDHPKKPDTVHSTKYADRKTHNKCDEDNPLVKPQTFDGLTRALAIDCEMVGVGEGGKDSILARVSIVNHFGKCILDKYVAPTESVTDYRTHVSGIRPEHLRKGESFKTVQNEVNSIIKGRLLVGHALKNDLQVLFLDHPKKMIRDTALYRPFRRLFQGRNPSLKKLSEKVLGVKVQEGEHNSVQDAQAAMRLYTMYRKQWEKEVKEHRRAKRPVLGQKAKKKIRNT